MKTTEHWLTSPKPMRAAMESDAAAEAMAYDGVLPETLVLLVER